MIEQSGGVAIQWYEKGINPYIKSHEINVRNHTEFEELGQSGGFSPDPGDISGRVRVALGFKRAGVPIIKNMLGHDL